MRTVLRRRHADKRVPKSAGRNLRDRWSEYVMVSTFAGAIIHAVVFVVWPKWNPVALAIVRPTAELVQVAPILASGSPTEEGDGEVAALPTEEEVQLVWEEAGYGDDRDRGDIIEQLLEQMLNQDVATAMRPRVVSPVTPEAEKQERSPEAAALILDQLQAISPNLASAPITVAWPLIRNPTVLQRFFRNRYNPWYDSGAKGSVSVAMWINEKGLVEWAAVQESSGSQILDDIALDAFNEVVAFAPARNRGAPVPVSVVISVPFNVPW